MFTLSDKKDLLRALWIILFGAAIGIAWNLLSPHGVNYSVALGLNKTPTPTESGK
jgi:hypothetical protein